MIRIDYKDSRSVHEQIQDGIRELIVNGILNQDEQLPSVRELSISLTVNPNTVQKAYKQLEIDGFIYSVKGRGNFVSAPKDVRDTNRAESLYESLRNNVKELMYLGESKESVANIINNIYSEKEGLI